MGDLHSVLFVCTGNSCRSIMAEGLMRKRLYELGKSDIEVASAGIMAVSKMPPTDETIEVMKESGVDVSDFEGKNVTADMIKNADLILTMESAHKGVVLRLVPSAAGKMFLLKEYRNPSKFFPKGFGIPDPIGKPMDEYRACRDEIAAEVDRVAQVL